MKHWNTFRFDNEDGVEPTKELRYEFTTVLKALTALQRWKMHCAVIDGTTVFRFASRKREKINLENYIAINFNKEKELRKKVTIFSHLIELWLLYFDLFLSATYLCNNLLNSRKLIPM